MDTDYTRELIQLGIAALYADWWEIAGSIAAITISLSALVFSISESRANKKERLLLATPGVGLRFNSDDYQQTGEIHWCIFGSGIGTTSVVSVEILNANDQSVVSEKFPRAVDYIHKAFSTEYRIRTCRLYSLNGPIALRPGEESEFLMLNFYDKPKVKSTVEFMSILKDLRIKFVFEDIYKRRFQSWVGFDGRRIK